MIAPGYTGNNPAGWGMYYKEPGIEMPEPNASVQRAEDKVEEVYTSAPVRLERLALVLQSSADLIRLCSILQPSGT